MQEPRDAVDADFGRIGGLAEAQEVFNPWDQSGAQSEPSTPAQPPMVRGDRIALRPLAAHIPMWVRDEVLDPWGTTSQARARTTLLAKERSLSVAARAQGSRLIACFPEEHPHQVHRTDLSSNMGGELGRCLRRVMNAIDPASAAYVLVLRFDSQGLRDAYAIEKSRM